jgi:hypothetical protein
MIRTLLLVTLLTLAAGVALGFFVADAGIVRPSSAAPADPVLDAKVKMYVEYYGLSDDKAIEIRSALREYDQRLADLLRRLRAIHEDEFRALADGATARIQAILPAPR